MFLVPAIRHSRPAHLATFERLFDDTLHSVFGWNGQGAAPVAAADAARQPALDVSESDSAFTATLDVPGVRKEDVKITVEGKRVSISAQAQTGEEKKEGESAIWRERRVAHFERVFSLPVEVDQTATKAALENGVLTLELPKRASAVPAHITIN